MGRGSRNRQSVRPLLPHAGFRAKKKLAPEQTRSHLIGQIEEVVDDLFREHVVNPEEFLATNLYALVGEIAKIQLHPEQDIRRGLFIEGQYLTSNVHGELARSGLTGPELRYRADVPSKLTVTGKLLVYTYYEDDRTTPAVLVIVGEGLAPSSNNAISPHHISLVFDLRTERKRQPLQEKITRFHKVREAYPDVSEPVSSSGGELSTTIYENLDNYNPVSYERLRVIYRSVTESVAFYRSQGIGLSFTIAFSTSADGTTAFNQFSEYIVEQGQEASSFDFIVVSPSGTMLNIFRVQDATTREPKQIAWQIKLTDEYEYIMVVDLPAQEPTATPEEQPPPIVTPERPDAFANYTWDPSATPQANIDRFRALGTPTRDQLMELQLDPHLVGRLDVYPWDGETSERFRPFMYSQSDLFGRIDDMGLLRDQNDNFVGDGPILNLIEGTLLYKQQLADGTYVVLVFTPELSISESELEPLIDASVIYTSDKEITISDVHEPPREIVIPAILSEQDFGPHNLDLWRKRAVALSNTVEALFRLRICKPNHPAYQQLLTATSNYPYIETLSDIVTQTAGEEIELFTEEEMAAIRRGDKDQPDAVRSSNVGASELASYGNFGVEISTFRLIPLADRWGIPMAITYSGEPPLGGHAGALVRLPYQGADGRWYYDYIDPQRQVIQSQVLEGWIPPSNNAELINKLNSHTSPPVYFNTVAMALIMQDRFDLLQSLPHAALEQLKQASTTTQRQFMGLGCQLHALMIQAELFALQSPQDEFFIKGREQFKKDTGIVYLTGDEILQKQRPTIVMGEAYQINLTTGHIEQVSLPTSAEPHPERVQLINPATATVAAAYEAPPTQRGVLFVEQDATRLKLNGLIKERFPHDLQPITKLNHVLLHELETLPGIGSIGQVSAKLHEVLRDFKQHELDLVVFGPGPEGQPLYSHTEWHDRLPAGYVTEALSDGLVINNRYRVIPWIAYKTASQKLPERIAWQIQSMRPPPVDCVIECGPHILPVVPAESRINIKGEAFVPNEVRRQYQEKLPDYAASIVEIERIIRQFLSKNDKLPLGMLEQTVLTRAHQRSFLMEPSGTFTDLSEWVNQHVVPLGSSAEYTPLITRQTFGNGNTMFVFLVNADNHREGAVAWMIQRGKEKVIIGIHTPQTARSHHAQKPPAGPYTGATPPKVKEAPQRGRGIRLRNVALSVLAAIGFTLGGGDQPRSVPPEPQVAQAAPQPNSEAPPPPAPVVDLVRTTTLPPIPAENAPAVPVNLAAPPARSVPADELLVPIGPSQPERTVGQTLAQSGLLPSEVIPVIAQAAERAGIPPLALAAIGLTESRWNFDTGHGNMIQMLQSTFKNQILGDDNRIRWFGSLAGLDVPPLQEELTAEKSAELKDRLWKIFIGLEEADPQLRIELQTEAASLYLQDAFNRWPDTPGVMPLIQLQAYNGPGHAEANFMNIKQMLNIKDAEPAEQARQVNEFLEDCIRHQKGLPTKHYEILQIISHGVEKVDAITNPDHPFKWTLVDWLVRVRTKEGFTYQIPVSDTQYWTNDAQQNPRKPLPDNEKGNPGVADWYMDLANSQL